MYMHNSGTVYVDGKPLSDYGLLTSSGAIYTAAKPIFEKVSVPGRNGDLIFESGSYENITVKYRSVILGDFEINYPALRDYLLSRKGYSRIEDDFTPDRFRLGKPVGDLTPVSSGNHQTRIVEISFECKPQWFLKSGEAPITVATGTLRIENPTNQIALPKIVVTQGTGTFQVNGDSIILSANNGNTVIDSELQDTYEGTVNRNPNITFSDGYPILNPGANIIIVPSGMVIKLYAKWWML